MFTVKKTEFVPVKESLASLLGGDYVQALCAARAALTGEDLSALRAISESMVEFFPETCQAQMLQLLPLAGQSISSPAVKTAEGATSEAFRAHSNTQQAPLSCLGYFRVGENGRLYITTKSAHYHAPLGHDFPGYRLLEHARRLGIPNAAHNNIRGHITRLTEERLAARMPESARNKGFRVLNLETGSLAAEAALKMLLARFYQVQADSGAPKYQGHIPVIAALGDDEGGPKANYHGTTVLTQLMRGMWPALLEGMERSGLMAVRVVRPNDMEGLDACFRQWNTPPFKMAGFFHELIMMNYGARALTREFVSRLYALCEEHDVPSVVDEIQTGLWSPEIYMFREYGVTPSMIVLGKGFPGGEYPASKIIFPAVLDSLPQFGALVTNGQEELASLAYLITLRWAEANAAVTAAVGEYYEERLRALAGSYPRLIASIEGRRHMLGVYFQDLAAAKAFTSQLQGFGMDISVQTYKDSCPPSALTKLPLICGYEAVDWAVEKMRAAISSL